jgi:hypothetical protein
VSRRGAIAQRLKRLTLPLVLLSIPLLLGAHGTRDPSSRSDLLPLDWIISIIWGVVVLLIHVFRGTKKSLSGRGVSVGYDDRDDAGGDCGGGGE